LRPLAAARAPCGPRQAGSDGMTLREPLRSSDLAVYL